MHTARNLALIVAVGLLARPAAMAWQPAADPFAFFRPTIEISRDERRRVSRGEALIRILPGIGNEIAMFSAVATQADGTRLILWERQIADLKRSAIQLSAGRFSNPPQLDDLRDLVLDDDEWRDIKRCRPGNCALKLAADEIGPLQHALAVAGGEPPRAQEALRRFVLGRVQRYLAGGPAAMPPSVDRDTPVAPVFAPLLQHSPFLAARLPEFVEYLRRYPQASYPDVESFVYWSKELFGGRPVVSATHISIVRGRDGGTPDALVAGMQIFATHYTNGSFSLAAILGGGPGSPNYLVYLNRSDVDVLAGGLGSVKRLVIERRLKSGATEAIQTMRRRLESGEPPLRK